MVPLLQTNFFFFRIGSDDNLYLQKANSYLETQQVAGKRSLGNRPSFVAGSPLFVVVGNPLFVVAGNPFVVV